MVEFNTRGNSFSEVIEKLVSLVEKDFKYVAYEIDENDDTWLVVNGDKHSVMIMKQSIMINPVIYASVTIP